MWIVKTQTGEIQATVNAIMATTMCSNLAVIHAPTLQSLRLVNWWQQLRLQQALLYYRRQQQDRALRRVQQQVSL